MRLLSSSYIFNGQVDKGRMTLFGVVISLSSCQRVADHWIGGNMGTAGYQMPLESAHPRLIRARDDGSRPLNESNLLKIFWPLAPCFYRPTLVTPRWRRREHSKTIGVFTIEGEFVPPFSGNVKVCGFEFE